MSRDMTSKTDLFPDGLIVLDIETTGFSPKKHHVIEIAAVRLNAQGEVADEFTALVKPPHQHLQFRDVRKVVREICNIDIEELKKAESAEIVATQLHEWWGESSAPWTAYNLKFERRFLDFKPWNLALYTPGICLMQQAHDWIASTFVESDLPEFYRGNGCWKFPKLGEARGLLERREHVFPSDEARTHRALPDAHIAAAVAVALAREQSGHVVS